jgi:spermidine synthase
VVFGNTYNGAGYDLVLLGQVEPTRIDIGEMEERLRRPEFAAMALSLRQIGFNSAMDLLSTYAGRARDLTFWLKDASINRDRDLRLQYLAGMGLNLHLGPTIYNSMLASRRFPDDLFVASEETKAGLWEMIQHPPDR